MKQRILSLLVAVALLCSFLPQFTLPVRADDPYSGTCGENLTWKFDPDTGTLTIEGSGDMEDYDEDAPWAAFGGAITALSLPDGLTTIGECAFFDCAYLTDVSIPAGVTSIGNWAFLCCDSLASVTIPVGVTSIGVQAFHNCSSLASVTIPDSVTKIGEKAFCFCGSLTSVTIPNSVIGIGAEAFGCCSSLTAIQVAEDNPNYSSLNGALFNKSQTELIQYPSGKASNTYTIPDNVSSIGDFACSFCDFLTSVTIPSSVTSIGDCAFFGCSSLTSVTIPSSVTSIGGYAFDQCSSLTSVIIPASVTSIGIHAFGWNWNPETNEDERVQGFTIYGIVGTAAEEYAKNGGFKFIPLDAQSGFCDVDSNEFYYDAMLWAVQKSVTNGTSQVKFSPADFCTRAQTVTFLWRANGRIAATNPSNPFVDVASGEYYYDPVRWAVEKNITSGTDNTHFSPDSPCTRAQVVTFLWRSAGSPAPKSSKNPFVDVKKTADCYYYNAVLWAVEQGITKGTDDTHFSPDDTCTRGQVVTFLYRHLG